VASGSVIAPIRKLAAAMTRRTVLAAAEIEPHSATAATQVHFSNNQEAA
jgi:hypothetical protein